MTHRQHHCVLLPAVPAQWKPQVAMCMPCSLGCAGCAPVACGLSGWRSKCDMGSAWLQLPLPSASSGAQLEAASRINVEAAEPIDDAQNSSPAVHDGQVQQAVNGQEVRCSQGHRDVTRPCQPVIIAVAMV